MSTEDQILAVIEQGDVSTEEVSALAYDAGVAGCTGRSMACRLSAMRRQGAVVSERTTSGSTATTYWWPSEMTT